VSLWPRDARRISHAGLGNRWGMPPSLLHVGEQHRHPDWVTFESVARREDFSAWLRATVVWSTLNRREAAARVCSRARTT